MHYNYLDNPHMSDHHGGIPPSPASSPQALSPAMRRRAAHNQSGNPSPHQPGTCCTSKRHLDGSTAHPAPPADDAVGNTFILLRMLVYLLLACPSTPYKLSPLRAQGLVHRLFTARYRRWEPVFRAWLLSARLLHRRRECALRAPFPSAMVCVLGEESACFQRRSPEPRHTFGNEVTHSNRRLPRPWQGNLRFTRLPQASVVH